MHLQQTAMLHIQFLQHQVYYNSLKADADVAHYLYDLPGVHPARNEFVFPSPSSPLKFVNLVSILKVANLGRCSVLFESSGTSLLNITHHWSQPKFTPFHGLSQYPEKPVDIDYLDRRELRFRQWRICCVVFPGIIGLLFHLVPGV